MTMIPVTTTTDKYDKPTRQQGGRFVVNADKVNGQLDKIYFFNLDDQKYYYIDEQSATPDYIAQVRKEEEKLANYRKEQERAAAKAQLYADTNNSKQINSFADVFAKSVATTTNPIDATMSMIEGVGGLIKNYTIKPLFESDSTLGEKAGMLLTNALTNLGETMDYFTGANYVKALVMGKDANAGYTWNRETGRQQYDWNIDTGNGLVDLTTNFFLEFISDPTNLFTLGVDSLLKPKAMSDITGVLAKSASDIGLSITAEETDDLARGILKSVLNNGADTRAAVLNTQLEKVLKINDPVTLNRMVTSLSDNAKALQESKNLAILSTVHKTSDTINQTAAKLATRTSVLGYGGDVIKLGFKGAEGTLNYALSKINNAILKGGDSKQLANLDNVAKVADETISTLKGVIDIPDDLPSRVVRKVTKDIQEKAVMELRNAVALNRHNVGKLTKAVDEWAQKQGFENITDAHIQLANKAVHSRIAEGLRIIEQEVFNTINTIKFQGIKDTVEPLANLFSNPDNLMHMSITSISRLDDLMQNDTLIKALPVGTFDDKAYGVVKQMVSSQNALHHIDRLHKKLNDVDLIQVFTDLTVNNGHIDVDALLDMQINLKQAVELITTITSDRELSKWLSPDIITWFKKTDYTSIYRDITREAVDVLRDTRYRHLYSYNSNLAYLIRKMVSANVAFQKTLDDWAPNLKKVLEKNAVELSKFSNDLSNALTFAERMLEKTDVIMPVKFGTIGNALKGSLSDSVMRKLKEAAGDNSIADAFITNDAIANRTSVVSTLDNDPDLAKVYDNMVQAVSEYSDTKEFGGLISGSNVMEAINQLETEGASADLLGYLKIMLSPILPDDTKNALEELYSRAMDSAYADIPLTAAQLKSNLDVVKLTQASSLSYILSTPAITSALSDIYANKGIGSLVELCTTLGEDSLLSSSASELKSLAHSTYVANKMLKMVESADIDPLWKGGIQDTLAGMMRMDIDDIPNAATMTDYILNKAKRFVDNSNSNKVDLSTLINNAKVPAYRVMEIQDNLLHSDQPSWKMAANKLKSDDTYDIIYSIGQTGVDHGTLYEFAYALPDGKIVRLVDKTMRAYEDMLLDSSEHAFEVYGTSPKKAKELLHSQEEFVKPLVDTLEFDTSEEFMKAVFDVFNNAKDAVRESKQNIRLLGFDNAGESLNSDKLLNRFLTSNMLNASIGKDAVKFGGASTVDIAQLIRIENYGAAAITDDVRAVVSNVIQEAKKYLDETNLYEAAADGIKAKFMPDFNKDIITGIDNIIAAVDNVVAGFDNVRFARGTSEHEYNVLHSLGRDTLIELRSQLSTLRLDLIDSLRVIGAANADGAKNIIVRSVFNELSGEPNIMKFFQNNMSAGGTMSGSGIKRMYRPKLFDDWFDLNKYIGTLSSKAPTTVTLRTAFKYTDIAAKLQRTVDLIKQPALILDMPTNALQDVIADLRTLCGSLHSVSYANFTEAYTNMRELNKAQLYAVSQQLLHYAKSANSDPEFVRNLFAVLSEKYGHEFAECIVYSDRTVMFAGDEVTRRMYTPGTPGLFSPLVKEDNFLLEFKKELDAIEHAKWTGDTLTDSLIAENRLREFTGFDAPHMRIKEESIKRYGNFVNSVQTAYSRAYSDIYKTDVDSAYDALKKRKAYTATMEHIKKQLDDLTVYHATNRVTAILSMDVSTYTKYLYKYSQGIQAFDLESDILNGALAEQLLTLVRTIKDNPAAGLKYYVDEANPRWMYIYLDRSNTKVLSELEKGIEAIRYTRTVEVPANEFAQYYVQLADHMDEVTDEAYSLSMQRSINSTAFEKEFLATVPDAVKNNILSLDYLYEHEMLSGFNHTIVGDYSSGMGDIYKTYSRNMVSNTASGMNSYFNNLRGKDMYTALMASPSNSLAERIDFIKRKTGVDVTAQDVVDALNETGYVTIGFDGGRIVEYPIKDQATLAAALKNNAILIDYNSYDRLQLMYNDNRIHGWLYKLVATPLLFIKLGMLGTPGWLARNIPDSFLKGLIGENAGVDYLATIPKTIRNMQEYQRTYTDIFNRYKGKVNAQTIFEYFRDTKIPKTIDRQLFNKMNTFESSSSYVATAAQLSEYANVSNKLFTRIKDNPLINKKDVDFLLKAFVDNDGTYTKTKKALSSLVGKDKTDILMHLFPQIPKKYGKDNLMGKMSTLLEKGLDLNPFMKGSNKVEATARMHSFLYASEYMPGTASKGARYTDKTQFNRAHDSAGKKLLETLLPFSSFQIDNILFWTEALSKSRSTVLSAMNDYLEARYDEEELNSQDIVDDVALRYLFLNGNIILDESTGLSLKVGDSLTGALQLMADPIGGLAEMVNVPAEIVINIIKAANADMAAYEEDDFHNTKPLSEWNEADWTEEMAPLIPFIGSLYLRMQSGKDKMGICGSVLPAVLPSIFSAVRTDDAGTSYATRPIGLDWYTNIKLDPTYKSTHRFVFGISYVPTWLSKNPATYVNTRQRLIDAGVPEELATQMVTEWGYYMKAPDYVLRQFNKNDKKKTTYPKKYYPERTYAKRSYAPKPKAIKVKGSLTGYDYDSFNSRGKRVFRSYRVNNFKRRFATMNGNQVSRDIIIKYRGYNASSERTFRENSRFRRQRLQRYSNNYTKIRL